MQHFIEIVLLESTSIYTLFAINKADYLLLIQSEKELNSNILHKIDVWIKKVEN